MPEGTHGSVNSVLDLGAYTGLTAVYFAKRYPDARILAVEPDRSNYRCLRRNLSLNDLSQRVRTLQACISDRPGSTRLARKGPQWGRSMGEGSAGQTVPTLTVGDALDKLGMPYVDLVKMDIEGAERLALEASDAWLPRVRWLLVELHLEHISLGRAGSILAEGGRRTLYVKNTEDEWVELDARRASLLEDTTNRVDILVSSGGSPTS